jgi:hypothetical protein
MGQDAETVWVIIRRKKKGFSHKEMTRGYMGVWVPLPDSEYL